MPTTLDVDHVGEPVPSAFPNGCHIAEVEVDPETGAAQVVNYSAVNDLGTIINPLLVEGQIQGGVVQGLGQALMEQAVYDDEGQLVTGSFMDYAMPRAHDAPMIEVASHPVPTKTNPLGAKGCGEAGSSGGLPAVANAVVDALSDLRHPASGNADDAGAHLAGDRGGQAQGRLNANRLPPAWRSRDALTAACCHSPPPAGNPNEPSHRSFAPGARRTPASSAR